MPGSTQEERDTRVRVLAESAGTIAALMLARPW